MKSIYFTAIYCPLPLTGAWVIPGPELPVTLTCSTAPGAGHWSLGHYIMGTLSHTGHSFQSVSRMIKMTSWPSFLWQMPRRASNLISPFAVFRNWRKASAAPAFPSCQRDFNTLIRDWELRLTLLSLSLLWHQARISTFISNFSLIQKLIPAAANECCFCYSEAALLNIIFCLGWGVLPRKSDSGSGHRTHITWLSKGRW